MTAPRSRRSRRLRVALAALLMCVPAPAALAAAATGTRPGPSADLAPSPSAPEGDASPGAEEPAPEVEPSPTGTSVPEGEPVEVPADPLAVTIERLTPSTVPERGKVVVTGTVRNRSDADWTDLSVYLLTSAEPLTTADELLAAVASDPRAEVGARLVEPGTYVDLPALAPGDSQRYRLSVPRSALGISGSPGVYWLGVHVLGTSDEGRLEGADGRARTFLPLVPPRTSPVELALGLQVRQRTARTQDGTLAASRGWERTVAEGGRLRRLLDLGSSAGGRPLTWVLDPAVADAVLSTARGNPALDLDPEPAPDLAAGGGVPEGGEGNGTDDAEEPTAAAAAAGDWLNDLVTAATGGGATLLALPYGDLDVSALTRHGVSGLVEAAFEQGDRLLSELGLGTVRSVLVPVDGFLTPAAAQRTDPLVPVVLAPDALPATGGGPVLGRADGGELLVAPRAEEVLAGPAPGRTRTALAVRQRLLADAALHALAGAREPLVRLLPPLWNPGPEWRRAAFFEGLDVPWVTPSGVAGLLAGTSGPVIDPAEAVDYPAEQARQEVPTTTIDAARGLVRTGGLLDELLTEDDQLLATATRQALLGPSLWSRERPGLAARRTRNAEQRIDDWLSEVTVRGPDFVTMSSESGTFQVTIVNGLDQPVTVGLRTSVAGGHLELSTPEPLELEPEGRAAVQIDARATDIGVHQVVLQPVTASGAPVGAVATIDVRSSRVGFILWIVMAVGATLLFVAIVVRLVRRVAQRRRTHGPLLQQGPR